MRFKAGVATAVVALQGCFGPYYDPHPVPLPAATPQEGASYDEVVVSPFQLETFSRFASSTDMGSVILRETFIVSVGTDASAELARLLSERGIRATARLGVAVNDLRPNQLLLAGLLHSYDTYYGGTAVACMALMCMTLFIWGGIIPWPVPGAFGVRLGLNAQVVDSEGRYVLSGRTEFKGYHRYLYLWPSDSDEDHRAAAEQGLQVVADALAERLRPLVAAGH